MTSEQTEALKLLQTYTAGRFDVWNLFGPAKASCRAHIMSALAGKRIPQSQSGVNALRAAFYEIAKPEGSCPAVREVAFTAWARAQLQAAA